MPALWNLKQWLATNRGLLFTTNRRQTAQEISDIVHRRTRHRIKTRTLRNLLERQPKTFDSRILQPICDAFQCKLNDFFTITPSSAPPANLLSHLCLQPRIKPCAIAGNESLRSFIARVQLAAIEEAVSISHTYAQAARRLGYTRTSLHQLHARAKNIASTDPPALERHTFGRTIPLPDRIFTINANEHLHAFIRRVQLAVIYRTTQLEGTKTRAAVRLGYGRSSFIEMIRQLRSSSENNSRRRPHTSPRLVPRKRAPVRVVRRCKSKRAGS